MKKTTEHLFQFWVCISHQRQVGCNVWALDVFLLYWTRRSLHGPCGALSTFSSSSVFASTEVPKAASVGLVCAERLGCGFDVNLFWTEQSNFRVMVGERQRSRQRWPYDHLRTHLVHRTCRCLGEGTVPAARAHDNATTVALACGVLEERLVRYSRCLSVCTRLRSTTPPHSFSIHRRHLE